MLVITEIKNLFDNTHRGDITPGATVLIVLKKDQKTGKLTKGVVQDVLTHSQDHHRGIKVRLQDGQVGRVQKVLDYPTKSSNNEPHNKSIITSSDTTQEEQNCKDILNNLFSDLPYCLVTPNYVFYQNTKDPERGVQNTIDNIYKIKSKFRNIRNMSKSLLPNNDKITLSEIREKTKTLIFFLKFKKISFFFVTKKVSAIHNEDSYMLKALRGLHQDWERKNGFNPDESWD